jgi:hypothetical protein
LVAEAIDDFTQGIDFAPGLADFYKRRGQSRTAADQIEEALEVRPHVDVRRMSSGSNAV